MMKNYKFLLIILCIGFTGVLLQAQKYHVPKKNNNDMAAWYNGTSFVDRSGVNVDAAKDVQMLKDLSGNNNNTYNRVASHHTDRVKLGYLNYNQVLDFPASGGSGAPKSFTFETDRFKTGNSMSVFPTENQPQTFYTVAVNKDPVQGYIFTINQNDSKGGATLGSRSKGAWASGDFNNALIVGRSYNDGVLNNYWAREVQSGANGNAKATITPPRLLRLGYDPSSVASGKTFVYSEAGRNYSKGSTTWGKNRNYRPEKNVFYISGAQNGGGWGGGEDNSWTGMIGEIIAYRGVHDVETARKIQTYLAIKFGITLVPLRKNEPEVRTEINNEEKPYTADELKEAKEYVNVDGESVWTYSDPYRAEGFNKHIFGLAKDGEDIDQQISHSTDVPSGAPQLVMAVDDIFVDPNSAVKAPNGDLSRHSLDDGKYIMFGDNGADAPDKWISIPEGVCVPGKKHKQILSKVWKSETTGDVPEVYGRLDISSFKRITEPFVIVASKPDFTGDLQVITENKTYTVTNGETTIAETPKGTIYMKDNNVIRFKYRFKEIKYFTFGGKIENYPGACVFNGVKGLNFLNSNGGAWKKHFTQGQDWVFDLGDDFNVSMRIEGDTYDSNTPREYYEGLLLERTNTKPITTTFTMNKPSLASFYVKDIDERHTRFDNVEITGYNADGEKVMPILSYVVSPGRSSYKIIDNLAKATVHWTYSFNDPRAELFVNFIVPVEKIEVKYYTDYGGYQDIGLKGFQFSCPNNPTPETPEEGFVTEEGAPITLTKSTLSKDVTLCEEVPFFFEIENEDCTDQTVNFEDTLPEGMYWVAGSVNFSTVGTINEYKGTRDLKITELEVPKATVLRIRAVARFNSDATAKDYENRAFISKIGETKKYGSIDKKTGKLNTIITATGDFKYKPLIVKSFDLSGNCFTPGSEATVTIELENQDDTFEYNNIMIDMLLGEGFSYVDGSLSGGDKGTVTDSEKSDLYVTNINVPAGTTHKVTFKVNTPATIGTDETTPVVQSIKVSENSSSSNSCGSSIVVPDEFQKLEAGKCEDCKKEPKKDGASLFTKVGFSTLKHDNDNWVNNAKNGFIKMESMDRPFVITRMTTAQRNAISNKVEGMMIWNTDTQCLELYKGESLGWSCVNKGCNDEVSRP